MAVIQVFYSMFCSLYGQAKQLYQKVFTDRLILLLKPYILALLMWRNVQ